MTIRRTTQKNIMVVSDEEWARADEEWVQHKKSSPCPAQNGYAYDAKQIGLEQVLRKNIKSLSGEPVLMICGDDGYFWSIYPYRCMVLNAEEIGGEFVLTVEVNNGERKGGIYKSKLWQIWQVRDIYKPNEKEIMEEKFMQIVKQMNRSRNKQFVTLAEKKVANENYIRQKAKDILYYEKEIESLEAQMRTTKQMDYSKEDVLKMFDLLKKNRKVANAYLKLDGKLVVETRMLYALSPETRKEDKRKPIGRIAMELAMSGVENCRFANLDFCFHKVQNSNHYEHPNIKNNILCYGENGIEIDSMVRGGNFYELIDFLIVFFSLFPHDSGRPYVTHDNWILTKKPEKKGNPFYKAERLWELYPPKGAQQKGKGTTKKRTKKDPLAKLAAFAVGDDPIAPAVVNLDIPDMVQIEYASPIQDRYTHVLNTMIPTINFVEEARSLGMEDEDN